MTGTAPTISVVINTYNRAASLKQTLDGLARLDDRRFEVVVVNGPSDDDTEAVLGEYAGRVKAARCSDRNLSRSRNIGIRAATGDLVAFTDDDAYPDPAWLDEVAAGFDDDEVAAAGGPVYDHTGAHLQSRYITVNRIGMGSTVSDPPNPTPYLSRPWGALFVTLIGVNSMFRRDRLVAIGGFDETYDYFLDETDVCVRLLDAGWIVRALDRGFVYHKYLPSQRRSEDRIHRDQSSALHNIAYFAFRHGRKVHPLPELVRMLDRYIRDERRHYQWNVEHGKLTQEDWTKFQYDLDTAMDAGMEAALGRPPLTRPPAWFDTGERVFVPFPTIRAEGRRLHVAMFTREYAPGPLNGIGRLIHALAPRLADMGHVVRVMTTGRDHDTVDLEDGVWVHRVVPRPHPVPKGLSVPPDMWNYCASLRDEMERVGADRPVDLVHAPNWDAEGLAVILDRRVPVLLELHTPVATVSETNPMLFPANSRRVQQVVGMERLCYERADGILASSPAIVEEVEARYGLRLPAGEVHVVAHGLPPPAGTITPRRVPGDVVNLLFVGRLERRKGIDTLLEALVRAVRTVPRLVATIAGDDTIPGEAGTTYRAAFEAGPGRALGDRVRFVGRVDDGELEEYYAGCDFLVVPSRYESFGLVLLEAMMMGKPVIAGDAGGMRFIVEEGGNGFRFPPGDAGALAEAIERLATSPELRERFGRRSREIYEERYSAEQMAGGTLAAYHAVLSRMAAPRALAPAGAQEPAASR
ncbi:MAG TPA: glycosyltransferase [Terriglobales bacterium]|nr:glycosyltransferase [Terriglobales bacterium]